MPGPLKGGWMFSSADDVLKFIADEAVQFVDVRFCDLPGIMQHFNVPAANVDQDFFKNGQMFDGSS
jgi:glutamine synthetase